MQNKIKIGARKLSENEIKLILPTYENILGQINAIRNSKEEKSSNNNEEKEQSGVEEDFLQKTNNIGIMGCRGSGKTSVLKTIKAKLEEEKYNDIILPIIVPENMSENSTLMATILALLKKYIDEFDSNCSRCVSKCGHDNNDNHLIEMYEETVKQYAFIQNDYRNILINQFTTENQYVKKINEVFNSDKEFIKKFNYLIEELIKRCKKNDDKEPLIIIFIDDIDLSTTKCTDVVKTLLSYISNQHILTFISGDLDTFEEALTLEFIRQEDALVADILEKSFLGRGDSLIERKKLLAYEYLKKVLPPVYRHNIKCWSLEGKGNYKVEFDDNKETATLSELLISVLEKYIPKTFF